MIYGACQKSMSRRETVRLIPSLEDTLFLQALIPAIST